MFSENLEYEYNGGLAREGSGRNIDAGMRVGWSRRARGPSGPKHAFGSFSIPVSAPLGRHRGLLVAADGLRWE